MRLEGIPIPGEESAEERVWGVLASGFEERTPAPRERRLWRPALVLAAVGVLAGVIASPPGRAVLGDLREAVGVKKAAPALFSLPAPGRLLVVSGQGPWVVQADGSKRLLGRYREASWSPHGLYLAATRANELLALDPKGTVRWSLARPAVHFPRWVGTRTDTRIAYLTTSRLHLVAGDGTRDVDLCGEPAAARVAPAWRPAPGRVLAYATTKGRIYVLDADHCSLSWRSAPGPVPTRLEWSSDGRLLLAFAPYGLRVYNGRGRVVAQDDPSDATRDADATFLPGTHKVAVIRVHGSQSDVFLLQTGRLLFRGTGEFRELAPSPDGRWLLVTWPTADQWVFVRVVGRRRIVAVSGITRQFGSFPTLAGWCCAG